MWRETTRRKTRENLAAPWTELAVWGGDTTKRSSGPTDLGFELGKGPVDKEPC